MRGHWRNGPPGCDREDTDAGSKKYTVWKPVAGGQQKAASSQSPAAGLYVCRPTARFSVAIIAGEMMLSAEMLRRLVVPAIVLLSGCISLFFK